MRVAIFTVFILIGTANAQNTLLADALPASASATPAYAAPAPIGKMEAAPNAIVVEPNTIPDAPSARKFWTLENKINFSIFAVELTGDAITTQRGLNNGMREANPLARPFVTHGAGGQAAASALGFGLGVGTAYWLHRTGHYKAERIAIRIMLAAEGVAVGQNIAVLR